MRTLIEEGKPPETIWDLKLIPGGLIDIEFIAQYLRLIAPANDVEVDTRGRSTGEALKALGARLMDRNDLETCLAALSLYTELSQLIRLCIDGCSIRARHRPASSNSSAGQGIALIFAVWRRSFAVYPKLCAAYSRRLRPVEVSTTCLP